jgi:hypothetical protein
MCQTCKSGFHELRNGADDLLQNRELKARFANGNDEKATYRRILEQIAQHRIPRVHEVVAVMLRGRHGPEAILERLELAATGQYHATGHFTKDEVDAASLALSLGSATVLHVFNHVDGLPSYNALKARSTSLSIKPCMGDAEDAIIIENMRHILVDTGFVSKQMLRAFHLGMDELSLTPRAFYQEHFHLFGGISRCCTASLDLHIDSAQKVIDLVSQLKGSPGRAPSLHLATQAAVVAMTVHGRDGQTRPFMTIPCCGQKDASYAASLFRQLIRCWDTIIRDEGFDPGNAYPWSIATDGDSARRKGGYTVLLASELDPEASFFPFITGLLGFNYAVGPHNIILSLDEKHVIKRTWLTLSLSPKMLLTNTSTGQSTLARSDAGVYIAGELLTIWVLARHMLKIGVPSWRITELLRPNDAQDVPRALELHWVLADVAEATDHDLSPTEKGERAAIRVFATLLNSYSRTYFDPDLSLAERAELLSVYAHLTVTLYLAEGTRFMPNPLYADSMNSVKAAHFSIARQQAVDGNEEVFLDDESTDGLEEAFGISRMLGGHDPNGDYKDTARRLSTGLKILDLKRRHPNWFPKERRRSTARKSQTADHLPRRHFAQTQAANSVVLQRTWPAGAQSTTDILTAVASRIRNYNSDWHRVWADADILKPCGDGQWVGVALEDEDRSMVQPPAIDVGAREESRLRDSTAGPRPSTSSASIQPADSEDDEGSDADDAEADVSDNELDDPSPQPNASESLAEYEHHEILRAASSGQSSAQQPEGDAREHFVEYHGKLIHIGALIRICMAAICITLAKDRILQWRGYQLSPRLELLRTDLPPEFALELGDFIGTFIECPGGVMCFAILKTTRLHQAGRPVQCVDRRELCAPALRIQVKGLVMTWQHRAKDGSSLWLWDETFGFASFRPVRNRKKARDVVEIAVDGRAVTPLRAPVRSLESDDGVSSARLAFVLTHDELSELSRAQEDFIRGLPDPVPISRCGRGTENILPYTTCEGSTQHLIV